MQRIDAMTLTGVCALTSHRSIQRVDMRPLRAQLWQSNDRPCSTSIRLVPRNKPNLKGTNRMDSDVVLDWESLSQ
jgi:hypothetical protein